MSEATVWRLLRTGAGDGAWNMALDARLLNSATLPVLRVYTWSNPAISLGFHQEYSWLDLEKCRRLGVSVVRRPTGGRAVYHFRELTYSLIALENDPVVGGSLSRSWERISLGLIEAVRLLGVEAGIAAETDTDTASGRSRVCFSSSRRFEIMAGGKKLVGSAQRRSEGKFLQQGSVRLRFDQDLLSDFVIGADGDAAEAERELTPLGRRLEGRVDLDRFAAALKQGFANLYGVRLVESAVDEGEAAEVDKLARSHRIA